MRPKSQKINKDAFLNRNSEFINMNHEHVKLADKINWQVKEIYCDKGYRGAKWYKEVSGKVLIPGVKQEITKRQKRDFKRRNAIEPIIGHIKFGHDMQRSFLNGEACAAVNALLFACGFNIRKHLKHLKSFLHFFKHWKYTSQKQILRFFRSYLQDFCKFAIVQ